MNQRSKTAYEMKCAGTPLIQRMTLKHEEFYCRKWATANNCRTLEDSVEQGHRTPTQSKVLFTIKL